VAKQPRPRINVVAYVNLLRAVYEKWPSKAAMILVLRVNANILESASKLRGGVTKVSQIRELTKWDEKFKMAVGRMSQYVGDLAALPAEGPDGWGEWVLWPLVYGKWPETFYEAQDGFFIEGRADSVQIAMLYNQIIEVAWVDKSLREDILLRGAFSQQFADLLIETARQLGASAPGEDPTLIENVQKDFTDGVEKAGDIVSFAAKSSLWILGAAFFGYMVVTWGKKGGTTVKVQAGGGR